MTSSDNIERTLGAILATQERILKELEKLGRDSKEVEKRVDKIENRLAYASGILFTVIALFSLTSDFILTKVGLK